MTAAIVSIVMLALAAVAFWISFRRQVAKMDQEVTDVI